MRLFPMQDGPRIPWWLAEHIYEVYSNLNGTDQSLEKLAKRGGFGWAEVEHLWNEHKRKHGPIPRPKES